jgi:hypothetical protein
MSVNPHNPYEMSLDQNPANFVPLTPLTFIERAASVYPHYTAVVHGPVRRDWAETYARCRRLASALQRRGIGLGDTVAAMLPNIPEMFELHFGVPMTGAVLNTLNIRLDAETIAFMLEHGEAKILLTDREFSETIGKALRLMPVAKRPLVIDVDDPQFVGGEKLGNAGLRDLAGRRRSRVCLAESGRRVAGHHPELHLRHHRQSQGRGLSPSRRLSERGQQRDGVGHGPASGLSVDPADVPLQRLVLPVDHRRHGRHQCLPAPGARRPGVRSDQARRRSTTSAARRSC